MHELHGRHLDVSRAVAPGCFVLEHYFSRAGHTAPLVGDGRTGDVAAQLLQAPSVDRVAAHPGAQAKAVSVGA